jgi:hypothetical protein
LEHLENLLKGSIDMHLHHGPSPIARSIDSWGIAKDAAEAGMRAVLLKDHHLTNSTQCYLVNRNLGVKTDFEEFGSICLNNSVGGFNPFAVDVAIKLGVKLVYFPTISAKNHLDYFMKETTLPKDLDPLKAPPAAELLTSDSMKEIPLSVFDKNGGLLSEVKTIIEMIAKADIILATGHLGYDEIYSVLKYATAVGVKKICLTHLPLFTTLDKEKLQKIVDIGGFVEFTYLMLEELTPADCRFSREMVREYIDFFGVDRCIFATDFGSVKCPDPKPVEGMRMVIRLLLDLGYSDDDIEIMIKRNPAQLLGI